MDVRGKKVLVVGLGRSGRGAASLARERGAKVVGVDLRTGLDPIDGVVLELGPHRRERFLDADVVVVSPGIPRAQPDVAAAIAAGKVVVGELAFAWSFLDQPSIAVTGTNGKSTVTWFTGQLLAAAGRRPFVGGNLGTPLSAAALEPRGEDTLVIEVSSYQLELPGDLSPDVGVILNLTPDHLARHGDMDGYARAKTELFCRQRPGQIAILPTLDARLDAAMPAGHAGRLLRLGSSPGVVREGARAHVDLGDRQVSFDLSAVPVLGEHNLDNAATAAMLAWAIGADAGGIQRGLATLAPLDHRMQPVHEAGGVVWVNDSKATNIDAARVGIQGIDRPSVVLLGGQLKEGSDFAELAPILARHRAVICFGAAGPVAAEHLARAGVAVTVASSLDEAVAMARALARPGDAVLLSPGGASFDAFNDFEHRGRAFAALAAGSPS
jgi:UDP-N-acetylmuramoylalanine--D-glutamate ligase